MATNERLVFRMFRFSIVLAGHQNKTRHRVNHAEDDVTNSRCLVRSGDD